MRGLVALYAVACEEEGTVSNSQLLQVFRKMDLVEENTASASTIAPGDASNHVEERARLRAYMQTAFPTTLSVGSAHNYLGDAGTAAVFRMLPHLRWVRRVEARATGANTRTVAALCDVLNLTAQVEVDLPTPPQEGEDNNELTDSTGGSKPIARVVLTLPAVPVEYVDLRDNAIFTLSARQLLQSVRTRQALVERARAVLAAATSHAFGQGAPAQAPRVDWPEPTVLRLDYDAIPATVARALQMYNAEARRKARARRAAERQRARAQKESLFCAPADDGGGALERPTPSGQHVVYRLPDYFPALPSQSLTSLDAGVCPEMDEEEEEDLSGSTQRQTSDSVTPSAVPFYDASNASAAALVREVNAHMEEYLLAHRCIGAWSSLVGGPGGDGDAVPATAAAAQICVDIGADVLHHARDNHAMVWLGVDMERRRFLEQAKSAEDEDEGESESESDGDSQAPDRSDARRAAPQAATSDVEQKRWADMCEREEVLYGVSRLLRGLLRNPHLEAEMNNALATPVLQRHLTRMRELYYAFTASSGPDTHRGSNPEGLDLTPVTPLRVQAARTHPWLRDIPHDSIHELRGLYLRVVSALVTAPFGLHRFPSLQAAEDRIAFIRHYLVDFLLDGHPLQPPPAPPALSDHQDMTTPTPAPLPIDGATLLEAKHSLALLCTAMKYFKANHPAACSAWNTGCPSGPLESESDTTVRRAPAPPQRPSAACDEDVLDYYLKPFGRCTCADQLRMAYDIPCKEPLVGAAACGAGDAGTAPTKPTAPTHTREVPRPCPACCQAALKEVHGVLNSPYALQREALMAPLRLYLPDEVRHFLLDMALERRGAATGWKGSRYVPALFHEPSSLEAFTAYQERIQGPVGGAHADRRGEGGAEGPLVTVLDFLAHVDGNRERLLQFCEAFAEWYRLRAIETFGVGPLAE